MNNDFYFTEKSIAGSWDIQIFVLLSLHSFSPAGHF